MKSSAILIGNPVSKKSSPAKINSIAGLLRKSGYMLDTLITRRPGDAERFAREIVKKQSSGTGARSVPLVIAAGGDGTFNEVINGLVNTDIPMSIIPLGTANILAREIGVSEDTGAAIRQALEGTAHKVSLGKIIFGHESLLAARHFILMAGIGFDGEAVFSVHKETKKYTGKGAYILSGIRTLLRYKPDKITLTVDNKIYSGYAAIISNASRYGGDFRIAPGASITKPVLHVSLFLNRKRLDILRYIYGVVKGQLTYDDVMRIEAKRVDIRGSAHIQVDGDYLGMTPATVNIAPDALTLVY